MEKKYPIGGYAPGNYQCHCATCGGGFTGDKRAYQCEPCAIADKEKFNALSPSEQDELVKRNAEAINEAFKDFRTLTTEQVEGRKEAIEWHRSPAGDKRPIRPFKVINKTGEVHEVHKYINDNEGQEHIWCDTWYGHHLIGQDCEWQQAPIGAVWVKGHYDRLYDQVKGGKQTVCYVDYNAWGTDKVHRDICTIKAETMEFSSRGHGYGTAKFMSGNEKELFVQLCESIHVEWLDESNPLEHAPNPDELWNEYSEYIPNDVDSCQEFAGSTVMSKEGFRMMMGKLKQPR